MIVKLNAVCKTKEGIRILASRRRSVRLGSDVPKGTSFTTEPVRIPLAKAKRTPMVFGRRLYGDSKSRVSTPLGQARL